MKFDVALQHVLCTKTSQWPHGTWPHGHMATHPRSQLPGRTAWHVRHQGRTSRPFAWVNSARRIEINLKGNGIRKCRKCRRLPGAFFLWLFFYYFNDQRSSPLVL
jgi:hypothetical protein